MFRNIGSAIVSLAVCGGLISLTGLASDYHVLFDIVSQFRIQYMVGLVVAIFLALILKRWVVTVLLLLVFAVHGYAVIQAHRPLQTQYPDTTVGKLLTVSSVNLLASNRKKSDAIQTLRNVNADIFVFIEFTPEWDNALSGVLSDYQHAYKQAANNPFGIAIYSKYPISAARSLEFSATYKPALDVSIEHNNTEVRVLAVHPPPPVSTATWIDRNTQLATIADIAHGHQGPLIVAGDLNTTHWSSAFSQMEKSAVLFNARRGQYRIHHTWPSGQWILGVPIDHILVNRFLAVSDFQSQPLPGSDHRIVTARVGVLSGK